jgi:hypothetical protein
MKEHDHTSDAHARRHQSPYARLGLMALLSFVAMYLLMYAMVDRLENVVMNLNQVYMAALMASPMVLIELLLMRSMYDSRKANAMIGAAAVALGVVCFLFIRQQTTIDDRQFLRSMIPHHAGAILMCEQAAITAAEIRRLCEGIIISQQAEIDQMNAMLRATRAEVP